MPEMKNSGIKWAPSIAEGFTTKRLKYILYDRNEKNNPVITENILSLTAKQGVVPLAEKEGGGNKPKEDFSLYRVARPGDIVMNCMNVISGSVAISSYFGCLSPVYYTFRTINPEDEERYFNYIFQTTQFQRSLIGFANGILIKESSNGKLNTIRLRVSTDMLGSLFVPYTTPKNQRMIADFLDTKCAEIDALSTDIQSEIETLEAYKRSVITEAVTKGLNKNVPIIDGRIFYMAPYNANWTLSKIGYECTKLARSFESDDTPLLCTNKGKVAIRPEEMSGKMVSEDNAMQGIHKGDIAIHGMDTWHGAIALSDYDGKITRVVHVCDSKHDKRFIVYYLQQLAFNGVYKLISNGVRGNTSDFRSWDKVADIYIALPERNEQVKISDHLDTACKEIESIIAQKQEQLAVLADYKKSLIYEYVTGKKEVPAI